MAKVVLYISMSLDGYIAGANEGIDNPMGDGGERLHDWLFKGPDAAVSGRKSSGKGLFLFNNESINGKVVQEIFDSAGAFLMGRGWFDNGEKPWGEYPPFHVPVFVITHRMREKLVKGATSFTFITEGLAAAVKAAMAAAGNKNIITGGADIPRQLLKAGLLDEMIITVVPVLLGRGLRLFDETLRKQIELEKISVMEAPDVTHFRFRVIKNGK